MFSEVRKWEVGQTVAVERNCEVLAGTVVRVTPKGMPVVKIGTREERFNADGSCIGYTGSSFSRPLLRPMSDELWRKVMVDRVRTAMGLAHKSCDQWSVADLEGVGEAIRWAEKRATNADKLD